MDVSIRADLPPARDQGPRPTCLAFAITAAHGLLRCPDTPFLALSEEMLHQKAKAVGGNSAGVVLPSAEAALANHGQCLLSLCPYEASEGNHAVSRDAIADGKQRKATLASHPAGFEAVKRLVEGRTPVLLVLEVYPSFMRAPGGVVPQPLPSEVLRGLHAVVGTGLVTKQGKEWIEFRNSWSEFWGDGGYGYLGSAYLNDFCKAVRVLQLAPNGSNR